MSSRRTPRLLVASRLRRHDGADRRRPRRSGSRSPSRCAPSARWPSLPPTTGGDLGPRAARPGRAVPTPGRGAPGRQPRLRVRHRLRRADRRRARTTARRGRRRAAGRSPPSIPGVTVETKPASVALHVRNAAPEIAEAALSTRPRRCRHLGRRTGHRGQGGDRARGDRHRQGRRRSTSCGTAGRLRQRVFFGDDVTDEKAFAGCTDRTSASRSAPATPLAELPGRRARGRRRRAGVPARGAAHLALRRTRHARSSGSRCCANARTVALLTPDATVTWLCHPEPDSAAVFARPARRRRRRPLHGRPAARGAAAEPALRRRHDDRRDPLGEPAGHRLPTPRRRRRAAPTSPA